MKRKAKLYEDEPETVSIDIGSYNSFTEVPRNDVPAKPQIGFIRQKPKRKPRKKK